MESGLRAKLQSERIRIWAAGLSVAAGLVHGAVTPEHLEEWWGYGLFFLVAALAQVGYGALLIIRPWKQDQTRARRIDAERYDRSYYVAGIAGNVAIVLLYLVTRTVGIPFFGPEAGELEAITSLSLVSKALELALIGCLVVLVQRTRAAERKEISDG